jgi:hypothetical protein
MCLNNDNSFQQKDYEHLSNYKVFYSFEVECDVRSAAAPVLMIHRSHVACK